MKVSFMYSYSIVASTASASCNSLLPITHYRCGTVFECIKVSIKRYISLLFFSYFVTVDVCSLSSTVFLTVVTVVYLIESRPHLMCSL